MIDFNNDQNNIKITENYWFITWIINKVNRLIFIGFIGLLKSYFTPDASQSFNQLTQFHTFGVVDLTLNLLDILLDDATFLESFFQNLTPLSQHFILFDHLVRHFRQGLDPFHQLADFLVVFLYLLVLLF